MKGLDVRDIPLAARLPAPGPAPFWHISGSPALRWADRVLMALVSTVVVRRACWIGLLAGMLAHAAPADQHRLGLQAYHRGDVTGAMRALRPAAQAGHAPSQALLGFILERADEVGEAVRWYRAAAAQEDPEGHAGLAGLLLTGRGLAKDEKAAFEHYSKAADLGHANAIEFLAQAWITGQHGADARAEPALARAALLRAAAKGHLASAEALSLGYREGRFGLPVDVAESSAWQARAAAWRKERAAKAASEPRR